MNYTKPPLHYQQQLDLLIRRGLDCSDSDRVIRWLRQAGYYRLSAYFVPFKQSGTENFRAGTKFTQIADLYEFDSHLRLLVLQALELIEVAIRAAITYEMVHDLGMFGYADATNFAQSFQHSQFMKLIHKEEERSSEVFVRHYKSKYTSEPELPLWMVTELISFGTLSKMYEHLRKRLRKKISRRFHQPPPVFESWLHCLTAVRNICAHNNRLWNKELAVKPELPVAWTSNSITNERFYAIALIIQTLLKEIAPDSQWEEQLKALFDAHPDVNIQAMHFPITWQTQPPWI